MNLIEQQSIDRARNLLNSLQTAPRRTTLSTVRALLAAAEGRYRHGAPEEYDAWGTMDGNPQRIVIPFSHLRDLNTSVGSAGGYVTGTTTKDLTLPLVGANVVAAGANLISGLSENQVHPHVTTKPPFIWQPTETTQVPNDTTTVLNQAAAAIHRGGINYRVSRQLLLQSNAEVAVSQLLTQLGNDALDLGALNGSGVAGQPQGMFSIAGVQSVSGTSLNLTGLATAEANCVTADADDAHLAWFVHPGVRQLLRAREITAGAGSLWPGRELLGHAAYVSSKVPSASLLVGDFRNVDILLFGQGVEVLVNPYADFQSGRVEFQVSVAMDVLVHYPASFTKSVSIT
ncbi:MAG: phage major capsid protein [Nitrospirae bacterium]|nr:phage major capsid protein [Nitrospirota bacterium]